MAPETIKESALGALSEHGYLGHVNPSPAPPTPGNDSIFTALQTESSPVWAPSVVVSSVSDTLALFVWIVNSPTNPYIVPASGLLAGLIPSGQPGANFFPNGVITMASQDSVAGPDGTWGYGVETDVIAPYVIAKPQFFDGTAFNTTELVIPAGTIIDLYEQFQLYPDGKNGAIMGPFQYLNAIPEVWQVNGSDYPLAIAGFASIPKNGKACIVFPPSKMAGTISYHNILGGGLLSPPTYALQIAPVNSGPITEWNQNTNNNKSNWGNYQFYSNFEVEETFLKILFPPGTGNEQQIFNIGGYYPGFPGQVVIHEPILWNFSPPSGQAIVLWLFNTVANLPSVNFNPATAGLLVVN